MDHNALNVKMEDFIIDFQDTIRRIFSCVVAPSQMRIGTVRSFSVTAHLVPSFHNSISFLGVPQKDMLAFVESASRQVGGEVIGSRKAEI